MESGEILSSQMISETKYWRFPWRARLNDVEAIANEYPYFDFHNAEEWLQVTHLMVFSYHDYP